MKNSNAAFIAAFSIIVVMIVGTFAFYGAIAYVVMHFLHKLW